jgi:hypothetical protein
MYLFFMKRCKKPLSKLLDAPLEARFGAEKLVLSATDENRFKVESMRRAPSPAPHISRLTENLNALSRQSRYHHIYYDPLDAFCWILSLEEA